MLLQDADGPDRLTIGVTGYQFPDALDLHERCSWHMVGGEAQCQKGSWQFRWQALTCDESPRVSVWLVEVAESVRQRHVLPAPLEFVEPNLAFSAFPAGPGRARIVVSFDLELQPPWHRRRGSGDPFALSLTMGESQLRLAAGQWDAERAPYPDDTPPVVAGAAG
jgi:hypothetical protein